MEYLDFEIEIGTGQGRDYPIEVMRSPAGERRGRMHFPLDELELDNYLLRLQNALLSTSTTRRRIASPSEGAVEDFGTVLYEALLSGDIRTCWELSRREAQVQDKGLRLKLRIEDPGMATIPWEFLFDRSLGEFLALSRYTPVVRYIDLPRVVQPLPVSPPLRILGMIASPDDLPPLNIEREKQRVERAVEGLQQAGMVELTWLDGGSWQDLQRAMRRGPWHIFHFVGHGRYDANMEEGTIALVGETGETDELTATQIGRLLADHPSLRLVLLNACEGARGGKTDVFSGTAATLVRRGLPAVVAMQYEITDRAAIEFARTFYEAVSDELPLDAAVAEARKAISLSITGSVEWGTPVLYMRSPDGVLFRVNRTAPRPPTATVTTIAPLPAPAEPAVEIDQESELEQGLAAEARSAASPEQVSTSRALEPEPVVTRLTTPQPPESMFQPPMPVAAAPVPAASQPPLEAPASVAAPAPAATPPAPAPAAPPPAPTLAPPRAAAAPPPAAAPPLPAVALPPAAATPVPAVTPVAATPTPAGAPAGAADWIPEYVFEGLDGQLQVGRDWIALTRRAPGGVLFRAGEWMIPVAQVTAVHVAPASQTGRGFIQVCFAGGPQARASFWEMRKHRDTVQFTLLQQARFESAKQWIEYYASQARASIERPN